jgi:hypothetical protein
VWPSRSSDRSASAGTQSSQPDLVIVKCRTLPAEGVAARYASKVSGPAATVPSAWKSGPLSVAVTVWVDPDSVAATVR